MLLADFGITREIMLVLGVLAFTAGVILTNVIRVDVVAVMVLVILGVLRMLTPEQLFSGFSSEAVIALIATMIISAGLERVGISLIIARWMLRLGRERPGIIGFLLMICAGVLASFMRSLGSVAIFLPIVSRIHARTGIAKGYLLMPMAFCAILGGLLTMVGTGPLILLNSLLANASEFSQRPYMPEFAPFRLFEVFPIGVMLLITGMAYLLLVRRYLVKLIRNPAAFDGGMLSHFRTTYGKGGKISELSVPAKSKLVGMTVKDLEQALDPSLSLVAIKQGDISQIPPLRGTVIKAGAYIAIMGNQEPLIACCGKLGVKALPKLQVFTEALHPVRAGLCEVVIPPSSELVGVEVNELHMRRTHRLHVLALCRGGSVHHGEGLKKLVLRPGDTLGIYGQWDAFHELKKHPDFFLLTTAFPNERTLAKKIPHAIFFLLLSLGMVVFGHFPISVGLLVGAVGMIATGVLSIDDAYDAVSWKTVFLLAGLIPLGLAMQLTGTAQWLVSHLLPLHDGDSIQIIQISLAIVSTLFALIVSNVGATILLVPIALDLALAIHADPRIFALTVALAASNTFLIPTHQVNALIAGPGGYKMRDFFVFGGWLTLLFWLILILGLQIFFRH